MTDMVEIVERWAPILGYEGRYEVSDQGRVRSLRVFNRGVDKEREKPRILTGTNHKGYRRVHLSAKGVEEYRYIHRLVLEAFIGACRPDEETAHLNGARDDNRLLNLVWVTSEENSRHKIFHGREVLGVRAPAAKLNEEQVRQIRRARKQGRKLGDIACEFSISPSSVSQIALRKRWRHVE